MTTTSINNKQQLIIDENIIKACGMIAGQKVKIIFEKNKIEIFPIKKKKSLRGYLKGMENNFVRENDRI